LTKVKCPASAGYILKKAAMVPPHFTCRGKHMFTPKLGVYRAVLTTSALAGVLALGVAVTAPVTAAEPLDVPVSINALMVTMIDHSAHHIWDHQAMNRTLDDPEWQLVEYFSIQLAGAGSLITLGYSGPADAGWVASEQWRTFAQAMSNAALMSMEAAKTKNLELLGAAADALVDSCEGCHDAFKPASPTEGIMHLPDYDHLYHSFL